MNPSGQVPSLIALFALAVLLTAFPRPVAADGDPARGKEKTGTCQACHGLDGKAADPSYPILAGQYESYMVQALKDYRSGKRTNAVMAGMSANLSDRDIEDLAAWYAAQEGLEDLSIR